MPDTFYPSVDMDFIETHMKTMGKLAKDGIVKVGTTTTFIIEGTQAIYKRSILIRELEPGQVCFEQATGLAARFGFMGALLEWLETNQNWKEGAYIVAE
ncbi:hypothetical protein FRZ67_15100 [Panacibacter ginsenosidivorans]|uniref:Uncharacterized protein n=1 Tax=Panacibacter ginsenosidivorans TaxID=1813871 RepID=A0A5B8VBC2_9BACT|nr:hypothetical protein [Panacibacter ginsenosidivorans]QEC68569.1 hypothetical protein FRZ67_15100 [Panacibacter ginsenosidivorans]